MKSEHAELTQRYLTLVKIDSTNLMDRIKERQQEYLHDFSLKRDRDIFKQIFHHRYSMTDMADLAQLPIEIIELANDFYQIVDDLYWYLMHTQDMPNTIEEEIIRKTSLLTKKQNNLILYIDVELKGGQPEASVAEEDSQFEESFDQSYQEDFDPDKTKEIHLSPQESTSSFAIEEYDLDDDS